MSEKTPQQYLGPAAGRGRPEPPTAWDMVKEQVMAPQYRESNLTCVFYLTSLLNRSACLPWPRGAQPALGRNRGGVRYGKVSRRSNWQCDRGKMGWCEAQSVKGYL